MEQEDKLPFTLDLSVRLREFFDFLESDLMSFALDRSATIKINITEKIAGTCFDKPYVPWDEVEKGHVLWFEDQVNDSTRGQWFLGEVTLNYSGVVFYRFIEHPFDSVEHHFEIGSLLSTKGVCPYKYILPKGYKIIDCHNPKQVYEFV